MFIFTLSNTETPSLNSTHLIEDRAEGEAAAAHWAEFWQSLKRGRQMRVLVWAVSAEYRRRYLKPGQQPVHVGEIFPSGLALAARLGRKSANLVSEAISKNKRRNPDDPRNFIATLAGLMVCYADDLDADAGAGYSDKFAANCEEKIAENPDWGSGLGTVS